MRGGRGGRGGEGGEGRGGEGGEGREGRGGEGGKGGEGWEGGRGGRERSVGLSNSTVYTAECRKGQDHGLPLTQGISGQVAVY